ncbi:hypothetical protein PIB30_015399 [Stylosanthes scabra]|uniref:NB-ARC domain-containing protein n=1 Tax=Stylosanthes scabra TaxID=79078 RepID=A0ABU6T6S9_9FABA|nr:hypothetical protein [Stylosanthes scabra]
MFNSPFFLVFRQLFRRLLPTLHTPKCSSLRDDSNGLNRFSNRRRTRPNSPPEVSVFIIILFHFQILQQPSDHLQSKHQIAPRHRSSTPLQNFQQPSNFILQINGYDPTTHHVDPCLPRTNPTRTSSEPIRSGSIPAQHQYISDFDPNRFGPVSDQTDPVGCPVHPEPTQTDPWNNPTRGLPNLVVPNRPEVLPGLSFYLPNPSIVESSTGANPNLSTLEAMQNKVQQVLVGKRYLLVLDDVWDNVKLEDLKSVLQCSITKGVSILVTTRDPRVASIMGTCSPQDLQPLSEDDNWSLFSHCAFGPNKEQPAKMVEIGMEIMRRCSGSPLAAKVLGSLLRNEKEEKQWLNVLETIITAMLFFLRSLINLRPFYGHNVGGLPPFNSLRALRTSSSQLSALKSLTHLRYLNLLRSDITTLPECISRLQKLQILKLEECEYLSCLPKQLPQLKDLRHLLIDGCPSLVEMPPNIGELKCLKTLNLFIVEKKAGYGLSELRDLQLGGKLHIKGLENVVNEGDARDANLSAKKNLQNLYLSWDSSNSTCAANSERLLEGLEPPCNLKSFGIKGYSGVCLPSWMKNTSIFSSLVMVILYDCKNCEHLPSLGKLPHLTILFVSEMKDLKYIDDDSYNGVDEKAFKSLKELCLSELPNLEGMLRDERVEMLPLVSKLEVSCVPKIKLPLLPSLEKIWLYGRGSGCDFDSGGMASIPDSIVLNMRHIKHLHISGFRKLKALPHELSSLSSLQELKLSLCDELESFSENVMQGLCSLRSLEIGSCKKLKSLSEGVGNLTCLESLCITECPKLVSLPSSMNKLVSLRDTHIISSGTLPEGLQHVPSLQTLVVDELNSIPEWLGDLTSLRKLVLSCEGLRSLPSS